MSTKRGYETKGVKRRHGKWVTETDVYKKMSTKKDYRSSYDKGECRGAPEEGLRNEV